MLGAAARRTSSALVCSTSIVQPAGEALAQVGMQVALEVAGELGGAPTRIPTGRSSLEVREGDLGRVAQVVGDVLVDRALVVGLRPATLVVAAAQVVLDELDLLERRARTAEEPRHPAVDEQHAPALGGPDGRQRLDERGVGDHRVVVDGLGEPEDLEEVGGAGGEDRQAVGAPGVQAAAAELGLHALEVGAQRRARRAWPSASSSRIRRAARSSTERTSVLRAGGGRELARVEVEEEREHLGLAGADAREAAQALVGDVVGLHGATLPRWRGAVSRRCQRARSSALTFGARRTRRTPCDQPLAADVTPGPWGAGLTPRGRKFPMHFPVRWRRCWRLCKRSGSKNMTCASS